VYSPLIGLGEADMLLVFEEAEALRYAEYLKPGGAAVVNQHTIEPITVTSGGARYPTEVELQQVYAALTERLHVVPGTAIARDLGNARAANVVLMGALSTFLEIPTETWLEVIAARVPPKVRRETRCRTFEVLFNGPKESPRESESDLRGFLIVALCLYDGFGRALFQATQALDAQFLVDDELALSLADGLFRAHLYAGPALDAIVSDYDHATEISLFLCVLASPAASPLYSNPLGRQLGAILMRLAPACDP
jgi:hypothetical protein